MDNLWAQEIDADSHIKDYQQEIRQKILDMYGLPAVPEEIEHYIQAASAEPAMEESAMFDAVVDVVMKGDYDYYIYDLVPLGHALYYLSMAKVYDEWINKVTKLREEMREYEEMVSRLKHEKQTEQDQILQELLYIKNRINTSAGILTDKTKTAFFFVVIPEAEIINDTQKAAKLFAQFDVPIAGYVVNRVIPRELLDQNIPEYLRHRIAMQDQHLGEIAERLRRPGVGAGAGDGARRHGAADDREAGRHHVRQGDEIAMTEITHADGHDYLREHPTLKYFFFGGKGGVGKTVFAAAAAIGLARQGRRTLLASTNPVHSLTSLLGQDVLGKHVAVEGVPNLWAYEIETKQTIERSKMEIREKIRWFLKFADITTKADDFVESATMNPAFEESAMFENMIDLMFKDEYDVYVFDTAPTANARRLLGMSKVYSLWVNKMLKSREEAKTLREMLSFTKKKEADPLMDYLVSFRDRMEHARVLLTDPALTSFFFVTLPEALPIAVVTRFIQWFNDFGIPVGGVLVNMVIDRPPSARARRVRQEPRGDAAGAHADDLAGVRRQRPRHRAAVRDRDPRGPDADPPLRLPLRLTA